VTNIAGPLKAKLLSGCQRLCSFLCSRLDSLPADLRVSSLTVGTFVGHLKFICYHVRTTSAPEDFLFCAI